MSHKLMEYEPWAVRVKSIWFLLLALSFNINTFHRFQESFSTPDVNKDGLFTISDLWVHAKETFFCTGDLFTISLAKTEFGQFFEMSTIEPATGLSFVVSFALLSMLYTGVVILITGENI
ncbi:MAG: hypothetical protein H7829_04535 [Magnetococcus sp. THC-1_WYH]